MRTIATFAAIVAVAPALAFAQGSTGGTLGKTDQSLSGGKKEALPERTQDAKKAPSGVGPTDASIFGRWRYRAQCSVSGVLTGTLNLNGTPERLHGSIQQDAPAANFSINDGRVSGGRATFAVPVGALLSTWNIAVSGTGKSARIAGTASHQLESCTVNANRQ
jgi:hypothetical protein